MTMVERDGARLHVEVVGELGRPAVLLSNSLGTDLALWEAQLPALAAHFRVVRYDPRGHGRSTVGAAPCSIGDLGRDALAVLDVLGIERTHFLGISMGGAVGQWLLANAPERLDRTVLACTAARFGTPESWNARILAVLTDGMAATATATLERWFSPDFSAREPGQVARIRRMLLETPAAGYAACCAALRDADLRQSLASSDGPVLLVTGADDPVVSAPDTAILRAALPQARHVELPARHIANIEAAAAFNEAVVGFLTAKTVPRRRPVEMAVAAKGRRKATRPASAARRPLAKTASSGRKTRGSAAKPTPARTARSATPAAPKKASSPRGKKASVAKKRAAGIRRPTKTPAARGAVKKVATKAKPGKVVKKAKAAATKRPPAARRKPAKTPRRPSGRRKT